MKTWEMYKIALENPKARFKRYRDGVTCYVGKDPVVMFKEPGISIHVNVDEDWKLLREPVDFMTAINSGRDIKYETWDSYDAPKEVLRALSVKVPSLLQSMINGKWYIE